MTDSFEKLRQTVFTELKRQTQQNENKQSIPFGEFLLACLENRGKTRDDFARELEIERELADAILDGLLPTSEISTEFLREIAEVVKYDVNLLHVMLGRTGKVKGDYEEV